MSARRQCLRACAVVYTGQHSEPLFLDLRWTKEVAEGEKSLDLTHARFKNDIATIAAPIHGIPKDELVGRDVREFKKAQRLRRAGATGLVILTLAAVTFGIVAHIQRNLSEARRLAAVSETNAAEQTDVALLLALESLNTKDTKEGWGALFAALSRPVLARSPLSAVSRDELAPAGHNAAVNRVVFSPDGTVLASMGGDGIIGLWDPATEWQIGRLEGHAADNDINEAAFSLDGSVLVTPSEDWTVRLWDVKRGVQLGKPLEGHEGAVWDVAFAPHDGNLLATASADSTVRFWDVGTRKQRAMVTKKYLTDGIISDRRGSFKRSSSAAATP